MLGQILQKLQLGRAEIAREQAASTAALTEALKNLTSQLGVVDVKGIGKPGQFKGLHEEVSKNWRALESSTSVGINRAWIRAGVRLKDSTRIKIYLRNALSSSLFFAR